MICAGRHSPITWLLATSLVVVVSGCIAEDNPRPADAPDFVIIGVSGHSVSAGDYNPEYLYAEGTLNVFRDAIARHGRSVEVYAFTDNLQSYATPDGVPVAYGFLSLLETLSTIRRDWISAYDDPTRVIVVAHSHGTVWAHLALQVLAARGEPIPVEYLVDIDAVSVGWEDDTFSVGVGDRWRDEILVYSEARGLTWPFAIWHPVDAFAIPGVAGAQDIEDIVPESVSLNLESWSDGTSFVYDSEPNHRFDGSTRGVLFFFSGANHSTIHSPVSDAVTGAVATIEATEAW